jgi:tRNA(fMet)-specific endonuclease VapC
MKAKTPADIEYGYQELAKTVMGFQQLEILGYPVSAIARCDSLVKLKLGVKKNDLRIAAIALEAGAIVVTRNLSDFRRVPGLSCEDWSV